MLAAQLERLTKVYLPATLGGIVLLSTVYHYLTTPFPAGVPLTTLFGYDVMAVVVLAPLLYHAVQALGKEQGLLFFYTVSFFVGGLEALWVFLGQLGILGDAYTYTVGGLWFFGVPLYIVLGWFVWVYIAYFLTRQLWPQGAPWLVAACCGVLGLCIDIWLDPVVVNSAQTSGAPNLWNWAATTAPKLLTVPLYNFIGWFLTAATVVYAYEISWAALYTTPPPPQPLRQAFGRLAASWLVFVVGTKAIQIALDKLWPGVDLLPLVLVPGGQLSTLQLILLFVLPALLLGTWGFALWRAWHLPATRTDLWLLFGFTLALGIDLGMAYSLQLAFPTAFVIYLVVFPTLLPLGALLHYLTRPAESKQPALQGA